MTAPTAFASKYGPRALITGASSGIGEEFARQLAAQGLHLMLVARREERLQSLAAELRAAHGVEVDVLAADLMDRKALDLVAERAKALGGIGLLVNNAGMSVGGYFLKKDLIDHERLLWLNVQAPMILSHLIGREMMASKRGGIIQVSSVSAFFPVPYVSQYAASKSYLLSLGEALSVEMKPKGIDVQVLCPGFTRSEMTAGVEGKFHLMEPSFIVKRSLSQLGRRVTVVPGLLYGFSARILPRILPRKAMVKIAARMMG